MTNEISDEFKDFKVTRLPPGPTKGGDYPRGSKFKGNATGTRKKKNNDASKGNQSEGKARSPSITRKTKINDGTIGS